MEKTDGTSGIASLVVYGEESDLSDNEEKRFGGEQQRDGGGGNNISDSDEDSGKDGAATTTTSSAAAAASRSSSSLSSKVNVSKDDEPKVTVPEKRKRTRAVGLGRLVSYAADDIEEEKSDSDSEKEAPVILLGVSKIKKSTILNREQASSLSRSVQNMSADEIKLPPEPTGKCSKVLQEKIVQQYEKMKREGLDLNAKIQRGKKFRNPSIYKRLIEFCSIDEKGTNYPPEIYDPYSWGKESYYDSLDKAQKTEMEKREKERKERTKFCSQNSSIKSEIEFVTGMKKTMSVDAPPDEKKRKTKWDAQPQGLAGLRAAVVTTTILNTTGSTLTTAVTGTKGTVIPALGNIMKKPK